MFPHHHKFNQKSQEITLNPLQLLLLSIIIMNPRPIQQLLQVFKVVANIH